MRIVSGAITIVACALICAPATARSSDVYLIIDDDPYCGGPPPAGPPKKSVTATMMPRVPDKILAPVRPRDAFVSGRVHVDQEGKVTAVDVFQEVPEYRGLKKMFEDSMRAWRFAPNSIDTFCSSITVDVDPEERDIAKGDKWADVDYPPSPNPTQAEPLAYPPDAFAAMIGGTVTLFIEVSPEGTVHKAIVREEEPAGQLFGDAAIEGVMTWRFDGATPGRYRLKVRFKPDPANAPPQ